MVEQSFQVMFIFIDTLEKSTGNSWYKDINKMKNSYLLAKFSLFSTQCQTI